MDEKKNGHKLKTIAPGTREIPCPSVGKIYRVEEQISYDRLVEYELLNMEMALGIQPREIIAKVREIKDLCNNNAVGDIAILAHDIDIGVTNKLRKRIPVALRLCCLFLNTEDEDRGIITEAMYEQKISDWKTEGYDMNGFFSLALATIPGLLEIFRGITRDTSQPEETRKS